MRVTGFARDVEVECDVEVEQVLGELLEKAKEATAENGRGAFAGLEFVHQLLQAISDDVIAAWTPAQREMVHKALAKQVARIARPRLGWGWSPYGYLFACHGRYRLLRNDLGEHGPWTAFVIDEEGRNVRIGQGDLFEAAELCHAHRLAEVAAGGELT